MNEYRTTKHTISIGFDINDPMIMEAKQYLKTNFGNKYDAAPHFNFVITALPEYRLSDYKAMVSDYFKIQPPIVLKFGNLHFEPNKQFFSIQILGSTVMDIHKDLLKKLNTIRDEYVREKDLQRILEGKASQKEEEYIIKYGYLRVLDNFMPHVTIGNINQNGLDTHTLSSIESHLNYLLNARFNADYTVNKVYANFFEDADIQSNYKFLWETEFDLNA